MRRVWITLLWCAWLLAGLHAPPPAQASQMAQTGGAAVETVVSMGGLVGTAAVDGQRAYVAEGADLVVLDISDPSAPQRIGRLPLDRRARSIGAAAGYAYLLLDYALWTVDVRDPARPQRAHVFPLPFGLAHHLRVSDDLLVARSSGTLYIFDLSDPAHPALQSTQTTFSAFFELSGRTLYLLEYAKGLMILDLSDPRAPSERSLFVPPPALNAYRGLAVSGGRAVISTHQDMSDAKHVLTVSVANPDAPALLGDTVLDAPIVALAGTLLAVGDDQGQLRLLDTTDPVSPTVLATYPFQARELLFRAGRLYAQGEDRLLILDVGSPSAPVLLGSYDTSPGLGLVAAVQREGQHLYASSEQGVQILDVSQPLTPTLQGFVPFTKASKLLAHNSLLYAVDQTALRTIDVSDPISLTERASIGAVQDVQIVGDLAYLTGDAKLRIYNIENPDSPALVGQLPIASVATSDTLRVWVVGARAYVGRLYSVSCGRFCFEGHMDLTVVDVANPLSPQARGRIDVYAPTHLPVLAIVGTTIYIPGRGSLIDAADPNNPVLRDAQLMSEMNMLRADGARAYATTFSTLETLDLSDPLEPRRVGKLKVDRVQAAAAVGDTAYLAADGLRVIDLGDPARPLPRATHAAPVLGLVADGPYVYLALGEDGLRIVRLNPNACPRPVYLPLVGRF